MDYQRAISNLHNLPVGSRHTRVARGINQRPIPSKDQSGYDVNQFVDNKTYLSEFLCGICYGIFNDPMVIVCCGQTYCSFCIQQCLTSSASCPNCRNVLNQSNIKEASRQFKNLLSNLVIKCKYNADGCKMKVKLSDQYSHLKNCEYRPNMVCNTCGIKRESLSSHNCIESLKNAKRQLEMEKSQQKQEFDRQLNKRVLEISEKSKQQLKQLKYEFCEKISKLEKDFTVSVENPDHLSMESEIKPHPFVALEFGGFNMN